MTSVKVTLITLFALVFIPSLECHSFARNLLPLEKGLKTEKFTHLHFYFHDNITGPNITSVVVAQAPTANKALSPFGTINVADDPLTAGPEINSKLLGRAQGLYAYASQEEPAFLMAFTYVFLEEKFNGSTLTVLGRNPYLHEVREMPVIGGSGAFRFARGYAQAKTYFANFTSLNAIVEYNVYVYHY